MEKREQIAARLDLEEEVLDGIGPYILGWEAIVDLLVVIEIGKNPLILLSLGLEHSCEVFISESFRCGQVHLFRKLGKEPKILNLQKLIHIFPELGVVENNFQVDFADGLDFPFLLGSISD